MTVDVENLAQNIANQLFDGDSPQGPNTINGATFIIREGLAPLTHRIAGLERENEGLKEWKLAALKTGLYCAGLDVVTVQDYLHHQANATSALLSRAEAAEARVKELERDQERLEGVEQLEAIKVADVAAALKLTTQASLEHVKGLQNPPMGSR